MGGYNTYCEILSFDKPALIVPRVRPREEQLIRARRAAELGLVEMLLPERGRGRRSALPPRSRRCRSRLVRRRRNPDLRLEGLPHISEIVGDWLDQRSRPPLLCVVEGMS